MLIKWKLLTVFFFPNLIEEVSAATVKSQDQVKKLLKFYDAWTTMRVIAAYLASCNCRSHV